MCSVVERQFPSAELKRYLRQAALFDFPQRGHETSKEGERATMADYAMVGGTEFVMENFFLPFPVVAVEDTASVLIVIDKVPGQIGLNHERVFVEGFLMDTPPEEFGFDGHKFKDSKRNAAFPPGTCMVTVSRFTEAQINPDNHDGLVYQSSLGFAFVADKKKLYMSPTQWKTACLAAGDWRGMAHSAAVNAKTALEEIMYFNTPDRFVVRRHAQQPRKKKGKGPELLRSHERDQYILLRPQEIREKLGMPDEPVRERRSPVPHARRRHFRTLRSDRFKESRGKRIIVAASWVGPTEGEHDGRKYEVCLDL